MDFLNRFKELTDPKTMLMGMVEQFIPGLKEFRDKINKPQTEGGLLQEGENEAMIMLDMSTGQPKPVIGFFAFAGEQTLLTRMAELDLDPQTLITDGEAES